MAALSDALEAIAGVRDRLEQQTADIANRSSAQLLELEAAMARVRAERDRTWIAVEDERVRLDRLALDAARVDAEATMHRDRAARLERQRQGQLRVIALLERDLALAREAALEAASGHVHARLRAAALRRERRAQLERSRAEIARCSAEHAVAVASLEATPGETRATADLVEVERRRERV